MRICKGECGIHNSLMNTYSTHADESDFGHTMPGQRSGEGCSSILPYLANSLRVNPNAGALSLARELRIAAERKKMPIAQSAAPARIPAKPVKRARK